VKDMDFWNEFNGEICNTIENSISDIAKKTYCINTGNGSVIKLHNEIYVLTCYHILLDNEKTYVVINDKKKTPIKFKMKVKLCIEFLDIVLLEFCDVSQDLYFTNLKIYSIEDFLVKISKIDTIAKNDKFTINFMNEHLESYTLNFDFVCVEEINFISDFITGYKIPFYKFALYENEIKLNGLSGSLITNTQNVVGMICISKESKYVFAFPSILLIKCVCSCLLYNNCLPRLLFINCNVVADVDDEGNIKKYGMMITKTFDIEYSTTTKKKFVFKKNDIILSINNNKITKVGNIYDEECGVSMSICTFAMFKNIFDNVLNIDYIREEKECAIAIFGVDPEIYSAFNFIQRKMKEKFIFCDGFVFVELTESILKYFRDKNIYIDESNLCNIMNCDGKKKKFVILVYIDYNYLSKHNKESYKFLKANGYPYKDNKLRILKKVANEEITGLNSLKRILTVNKANKKKTYTFD
jgi:hypothetical protein